MKYIFFNKLTIRNFLSVGDTPVCVDFKPGFNVITGLNKDKEDRRNGVGKSTIADAIYFAVFGDTLRDLKKEHMSNNVTQSGAEVSLEFVVKENESRINYKIMRVLQPTKCYLYVDGEDKTRDSISNTNEYIADIINSSAEIFQNCIIMTVNNTVPFMAKRKIEKRKFIEGIFNLQVFSSMLTSIRGEYNDIMREFDSECVRYEEISNTLQSYETQKLDQHKQKESHKEKLTTRKTANYAELTSLLHNKKEMDIIDLTELEKKKQKCDENQLLCQEKIDKYTRQIAVINNDIKHLQKTRNNLGTSAEICPTCSRSLNNADRSHIDTEKSKLQGQIDDNTVVIETTTNKLEKARKIATAVKAEKAEYINTQRQADLQKHQLENMKDRIAQLKKWNEEILEDINQVDKQDTTFDKSIAEYSKRLEKNQEVIDVIKKQINTLDIIKFIVSEEGVKSYIVKKILQLFNSKLAYYLKKMDANCICVFNEYFEEQIIDEKGKICSYFNFSGAERKNIDLACLFAFMDIRRLQGDVAFNFSIYDELFDSSLDERGVELVVDILNDRAEKYNECIMVISHRKESTKLASGEIIFLEKTNGITTRVAIPENLDT
jgi:DNA repair exonuclease SbcCD ATPase subunit